MDGTYGKCCRNRELGAISRSRRYGKGRGRNRLALDQLRELEKACQMEEWCKNVEEGI